MIQYFENFISKYHQSDLYDEIFNDRTFLWQFKQYTSSGPQQDYGWVEDANTEDAPQLVHVIKQDTKDMALVTPIIYKIMETLNTKITIQRMKINMMWPNASQKNPDSYNRPHADHGRPDAMTLIYYVNDADGDTILFDKFYTGENPEPLSIVQRFRPKQGDAILFDSIRYHASSTPSTGYRSVINFIFWPQEENKLPDGAPSIPDIWVEGAQGYMVRI